MLDAMIGSSTAHSPAISTSRSSESSTLAHQLAAMPECVMRQTTARAAATVGHRRREEPMAAILDAETRSDARPQLRIEDVEYQRQGGQALLARVYRPTGTGPYPALVQVHG